MLKRLLSAALLLSVCSCVGKTTINPVKPPREAAVYIADGECKVRDYPNATEVPEGAKNLGWVEVPFTENDEETYIALRKKICGMGGDALSQLNWTRSSTETTAQAMELRANAWVLP